MKQTSEPRLPSQLVAARASYLALRYAGAAPDFARPMAPRRRSWLILAAAASVLTAVCVGWLLGGPDLSGSGKPQTPAQWSSLPAPPTAGLVSVPHIARPDLPARPAMPSAPRRHGGFAADGDLG